MNKNKDIFIVAILMLIVVFFIYIILSSNKTETSSSLLSLKGNMFKDTINPILIVSDVKTTLIGCDSEISGKIKNIGNLDARNVIVKCNQAAYPLTNNPLGEVSKGLGVISNNQESEFIIIVNGDCTEKTKPRFECNAVCDNC